MFESAVDILILLNYMVKLAGQINMLPDDVSRIKLELLPLLQKIITQWHTIYFFGTTPCESPPMEDSSSRLSLSDGWANQSSWNVKLGKCDFTLAFLLILDRQRSFQGQNGANLRHLPNPISFSAPLRKFSSWIVWGMIENGSSSSVSSTRLPLILLKYGQFDAAERPDDVIRRNKPFAMWFPYTTIERLKCKLEELINSGQMVAEYEEQRNLLETALLKHFQLLQSDSDNVMEMPFATS